MPVPAQPRVNRHTGNGVTDTWAYGFRILNKLDIGVDVDGALLTVDVDYTVTDVGEANGGTIVFAVPPANLAKITLYSNAAYARTRFDYVRNGSFKEETVDADFDQIEIQIQQLDERFGRGLNIPISDATGTDVELPSETDRAGMLLGFDVDGNVVALAPADLDITMVSAYIATLLDDPDAATARITLGAVAKSGDTMTGALVLFGGDTINTDPAASDNSKKLPSTKWVWNNIQALVASCIAAVATAAGFAASLAANGYVKFPSWLGGLIIEWGIVSTPAGTASVTFPLTFPTAVYSIIGSSSSGTTGAAFNLNAGGIGTSGFSAATQTTGGNVASTVYWMAVGR